MNAPDLTEKQLSSTSVYDGRLLHVKEDQVLLPNGNTATREYIVHPGAVVVVPLLENGDVLMVRQFRYPLQRDFLELPAGKIDADEDVLACGQRELLEETGYAAKAWQFLTTIHPCIGYSDERILIYLARDLTEHAHQRDEDEFLENIRLPYDTAMEWVRNGRISDVKTMVGLFWAEKIVEKRWVP
ncbi:MAG: NUDIX hydrolase [Gammaproteobacteria bacterium]|nr:NUDIX hydrolase [Gammaproteobacteria bacterium]